MAKELQSDYIYAGAANGDGDDAYLDVTVTDGDDTTALDLTQLDLAYKLAVDAGSTALITKTSADAAEIEKTDAVNGVCRVKLTHSNTAALEGNYWHQLVVTDPNGNISTVMTGRLRVKPRS